MLPDSKILSRQIIIAEYILSSVCLLLAAESFIVASLYRVGLYRNFFSYERFERSSD